MSDFAHPEVLTHEITYKAPSCKPMAFSLGALCNSSRAPADAAAPSTPEPAPQKAGKKGGSGEGGQKKGGDGKKGGAPKQQAAATSASSPEEIRAIRLQKVGPMHACF